MESYRCVHCGREIDDPSGWCSACEANILQVWAEDYAAIATGRLSQVQHELKVALYTLKHPEACGPKAIEWSKAVVLNYVRS